VHLDRSFRLDEFRYFLALVLIIIMPVVITFWVVIHGGSRQWRKRSPEMAYSFAGFFILIVVLLVWSLRSQILGSDLGFNLIIFISGAAIYIASFVLWKPVKPRYLMVAIGIAGWCLMSNYSGGYLIGLLSIAGLFLIVWLEEKDLVIRFGEEYQTYQKEVPQLIPTLNGIKRFWDENFRSSNRDSD